MKRNISYVFPNISAFNRNGRGGLKQRFEIAKAHGCSFVEVPADFVKNKTEVQLTGKELGSILCVQDIQKLYESGSPSKDIEYILHTEPQLSRRNVKGYSCTPKLKWNDQKWVQDFTNMAVAISKRFDLPPAGIEIHPGGRHNSYSDIVRAIKTIRKSFEKNFNTIPFVVLKNRTGQFVSNGEQINKLWQAMLLEDHSLRKYLGIVLDIQQLFTVSKSAFLKQLYSIPRESVRGFHIHFRHRTPSVDNSIPWKEVFAWIMGLEQKIFVNPEVHHHSQAIDTISFCNEMMEKSQKRRTRDGEKHAARDACRSTPKKMKKRDQQVTGNVGLYWTCYHLSRMGWNVMPTSRNARGVDIIAYNSDCSRTISIQVKSLSRKNPVPLGKSLDKIMGDFWVVVNDVINEPQSYILLPGEIRSLAHRGEKDGRVSFWLQPSAYCTDEFHEAWDRIGEPEE